MRIVGVYKITSPDKKVYIGQSVDVLKRWRHYINLWCVSQVRLHSSLKKYGPSRHKFELLCQCSRSELNELEVYYIELYQSFNTKFGLNLRSGGECSAHSEETKRKIGAANRGKKASLETRQKQRVAKIGKPSPWKGRKASEKTKKKQSDSHKLKLSESDLMQIRKLYADGWNYKKIGNVYSINSDSVRNIVKYLFAYKK